MIDNIELIQYRREKANQSFKDAKLLFENNSFVSSVNRIYYSLFYEVSALLLIENLSSLKHSGIMALFQKNFVKTEIVQKDLGRFYSKMFEYRQMGDYVDFHEFDKSEVHDWLNAAEQFIDKLEKLIIKKLN